MNMEERIIYHGSQQIAEYPEIRQAKYNKDFSAGFYCTILKEQAIRWAIRHPVVGYVNEFAYRENPDLKIRHFSEMTEEWLDFIVACRSGCRHDFDIVEGPMANDTIYNYIQDFIDGNISREAFWALAKFKYPTHQISFHTQDALKSLSFRRFEAYEKD